MILPIDEHLQQILFSIAYKMTGEISISQDIKQEAISKYLDPKINHDKIENPRSYLIKITVNTAIDYLNQQRKERESYVGTWLPEPIIQPEKIVHTNLDIDYGITLMLSRLTPKERAIFILKKSFDYSYSELAETLALQAPNCRKIYQRLKEKINKPNYKSSNQHKDKKRIVQTFLHAAQTGNLEKLIGILKKDIALYSDSGGKVSAARNVLYGLENCSKFLWGIYNKYSEALQIVLAPVNNEVGFIIYTDEPFPSIGMIDLEDGKVSSIYFVRNPDKIHII